MRNENLLSFLLIKRRILKLLAIKYAYSLIVLCGISFMACSDDDPVKKNPYLQTSTRAMLKEVVEVVFNNIDSNTDVTVDFGDGTVKEGKAATPITHAYTQSGDYTSVHSLFFRHTVSFPLIPNATSVSERHSNQ